MNKHQICRISITRRLVRAQIENRGPTYPDRNEWRPNPLSYALSVFSFAGVGVQSRLRMRYRAQSSCARGAFFLGGG